MEITEIMTKGADYKWVYLIATHPPLPKVTFVICLLLFHVSLLPNTVKGSGMQMIDVTGVRLLPNPYECLAIVTNVLQSIRIAYDYFTNTFRI